MIRTRTKTRLALAAFGLALAACAPPAAKREPAPAPAPSPSPVAWEPADGPGQSALIWRDGGVSIILSCTQKCDPTAKPAPGGPQPICVKDHATLQVSALAPPGTTPKVGDAATLFIGPTPFAGKLSADEETQPGMVELRVKLDAGAIAAIAGAKEARLTIGEAATVGGLDTTGQFQQFAQSCAIHAGAT